MAVPVEIWRILSWIAPRSKPQFPRHFVIGYFPFSGNPLNVAAILTSRLGQA